MGRNWLKVDANDDVDRDATTRQCQSEQHQCQIVDRCLLDVEESAASVLSRSSATERRDFDRQASGRCVLVSSGNRSADRALSLQHCETERTDSQRQRHETGLSQFDRDTSIQLDRLKVVSPSSVVNAENNTKAKETNYCDGDNGCNSCATLDHCGCDHKRPPSGEIKPSHSVCEPTATTTAAANSALQGNDGQGQLDSGRQRVGVCCCLHLASDHREQVVCRGVCNGDETVGSGGDGIGEQSQLSERLNSNLSIGKRATELSCCDPNETSTTNAFRRLACRLTGTRIGQSLYGGAPRLQTRTTLAESGCGAPITSLHNKTKLMQQHQSTSTNIVDTTTNKHVKMDPRANKFTSRLQQNEHRQSKKLLIEQQWQPACGPIESHHKQVALLGGSNMKSNIKSIGSSNKCKLGCPCKKPSIGGNKDHQHHQYCTNPRPVLLDTTKRSLGEDEDCSSKHIALSAFANTDRRSDSNRHGSGAAGSNDRPLKARENWSKNIEFLLAVIGFAVDLGNVWRFPYICYRNGGGAFLIPYTIMFILGGLPIFYLEMSLGQYFSNGCLTVWRRVCPMAKGIGYAMCVLNFFTGLYYNTIISWAVFFFVESFATTLPWTSCNNSWNEPSCRTIEQRQDFRLNATEVDYLANSTHRQHYTSPTSDYFDREVLQINKSTGIDDLGSIRKPLAIYLAIVFVCIYLAIWKGVKSTGKAVWITALLPYFVLIPLLVRGLFLEGAWTGIKYYLYPDWAKILDVDVWVEAAKQIYFSLGPGFGTLMALSSYNKFHHNCQKDAIIAAAVNYFASFISGLVIFAVLGYMATMQNVEVSDVATEGPGLVFIVYPEGLATMQFSAIWSILFFMMVITLGIDSTFGGLESVITGLCDEYPRVLRAHRGIFIGLLIILIYLCSIPTTTYGGNHVIYLLESYGTSLSLLFIVCLETIIVCWIYGADKFCENLEEMYGERPSVWWRICWKYISPTILVLIFFAACSEELGKYQSLKNGDYTYPSWAPSAGLLMTGSSVCCVPIYAIYYLKTKTAGSFTERLRMAIKPLAGDSDEEDERSCYYDDEGVMTNKIKEDNNNDVHLDTVI